MTAEELKQTISMKEVLSRYGISVNNRGFCKCPFHVERTPSMRVWKDHVYCYGACHEKLDQIDFVMKIDHCDFNTAFTLLGGTREKLTEEQKRSIAEARRTAELKKEEERLKKHKRENLACLISACRELIASEEPYSDVWCYTQNKLPYAIGLWEESMFDK